MATILSIDETFGLDGSRNDTSLALPTAFTGLGTSIEKARVANALSFTGTISDVAFTDVDGDPLLNVQSGLFTLDGNEILLSTSLTNNNLVLGRESGSGDLIFAIYLETNGTSGDSGATSANIWVALYEPLRHNLDGASPNDFVSLTGKLFVSVTEPVSFNATGAPSGNNLFITYGDGTPDPSEAAVVVTAVGAANQSEGINISSGKTVKSSQAGSEFGGATFGVDSQMYDPGEAQYFTFVTGANPDFVVDPSHELSATEADVEANIDFTGMFLADEASFRVVQTQPGSKLSTLKINAYLAVLDNNGTVGDPSDDTPFSGVDYIDNQDNNTTVDIDTITITRGTGSWTFTEGQAAPAGVPADLTVDFSVDGGFGVKVRGTKAGDEIAYVTIGQHDRLKITNVGDPVAKFNASFDIGGLEIDSGEITTNALDNIDFYDDGPTTTTSQVTGTVDEDGIVEDVTAGTQTGDGIAGGPAGTGTFADVTGEAVTATGSVAALFNSGKDVQLTYSLKTDTSGLPSLFSGGTAVAYSVDDGVNDTLIGYRTGGNPANAADQVFTFVLEPDGDWTFTLIDQLDHATLNTLAGDNLENDLAVDLSSVIQAKDKDNDPVTAATSGLVVTVDDDTPIPVTGLVSGTVDEDGVVEGASDGGPGDGIAGGTGDVAGEAVTATGSVASLFQSGADEALTYGLAANTVATLTALNLTSGGVALGYALVGNTVTASVAAGDVFTFSLNATTGAWTFTLIDQLDHPTLNGLTGDNAENDLLINLGGIIQATDFDGDTVSAIVSGTTAGLVVTVDDDTPKFNAQIIGSVVDFLDGTTVTSSLNGAVGADQNDGDNESSSNTKTYTFTSYTGDADSPFSASQLLLFPDIDAVLSSDGTVVTYYSTSDPLAQGPATELYKITLNQSGAGSYTFQVLDDEPDLSTSFGFEDLPSGSNLFGIVASDKTNVDQNGIMPDGGLFVTGTTNALFTTGSKAGEMTNTSSSVSSSQGGANTAVTIGIGPGQNIRDGKGAFFVYVDDQTAASTASVGLTQNSADDADTIRFNGTHEVTTASTQIVQGQDQGAEFTAVKITAYNVNPGDVNTDAEARAFALNPVGTGSGPVNIDSLRVYLINGPDSETLVESWTDDDHDGVYVKELFDINGDQVIDGDDDLAIDFEFPLLSAGVHNVLATFIDANYRIEWDTQTPHDASKVESIPDQGSFDIGGFAISQASVVADQLFDFSVKVTDWDEDLNDASLNTFEDFSVLVNGTSNFLMNDISNADVDTVPTQPTRNVAGFTPGTDKLDFFVDADGTNYEESLVDAVTLATFITNAGTELDGTTDFYFGVVGADGYLAYDADGIGITSIVKLVGVTNMDHTDIILGA